MQPFDVLEDDTRDWAKAQRKLLSSSLAARLQRELQAQKERVDWSLVASLASNPRGVPVPITDSAATMEQVLAAAPRVRNFFFSSRRRHTRSKRDWSSDVCSSD